MMFIYLDVSLVSLNPGEAGAAVGDVEAINEGIDGVNYLFKRKLNLFCGCKVSRLGLFGLR